MVESKDLLSFTKLAEEGLELAIRDLTTDTSNKAYLTQVVGLLVGVMAVTTGHRKCVFLGMTMDDVLKAQEYKKTFTIRRAKDYLVQCMGTYMGTVDGGFFVNRTVLPKNLMDKIGKILTLFAYEETCGLLKDIWNHFNEFLKNLGPAVTFVHTEMPTNQKKSTSKQQATPHSAVSVGTAWQQIQRKPTTIQPAAASSPISVNTAANPKVTTNIQPATTRSADNVEMAANSKKTTAYSTDNMELAELVKVAVVEAIKEAIPTLVEDVVSHLTNKTQALVDAQVAAFRGEMVATQADIYKCMNYMEKDESRVVEVDRRLSLGSVEIMCAHRVGPPKEDANGRPVPRTIILKLLRFTDRDKMLKAVRGAAVELEGKTIRFTRTTARIRSGAGWPSPRQWALCKSWSFAPFSSTCKTQGDTRRNEPSPREGLSESPDLEFDYADTDKWAAELSELYSYTEGPEFTLNRKCFEEEFRTHVSDKKWTELDAAQHRAHAMRLLDSLEVIAREKRLKVARAILYMAQGTFAECSSEAEVQHWMRYNIFLLLDVGTFSALVELLNMEIDNSAACSSAVRKPAISLADSTDLRVLLNIMYLMVETIQQDDPADEPEWKIIRETFRTELVLQWPCPHFPMKKVLLLLWKSILFTLGGFEQLQSIKVCKREELGLPPLPEDSIRVIRSMRAASPPASASDLIEQQQKRARREHKALIKQDNLDAFNEKDPYKADDSREDEDDNDDNDNSIEAETFPLERDEVMPPPIPHPPSERVSFPKGLPWAPKVREKDIENFLESSRSKFIGYTLGSDTDTVVGLPRPIHESIKTLKQHKYVSIAEIQITKEEEFQKTPLSGGEEEVEMCATELLYQGILPSLPQYMIALLKILLAAAPTSKAKTDSINILADVLPEEMPTTVLQSMKLGVDVNRHKEIIVKAISAILLLLLKHFKLNHIYQFEYMAQHLVFANCIPLILKFFNQNIMSYITAKNSISVLDFPYCVVHELPELTAESLEAGDNNQFCWRNLFSCINLLRILNKLTKWKHSRTMMLVVFKSAPILKRALKVKQAMMQLYVLKLLKVQTKYLGRQWRKSNMKTMSAIYQKVRHRLNDDWAYGNDLDARPWDFQAEECALRANIERFNSRRYDKSHSNPDFLPVDNCLQSVLGQRVDLPEDFQMNYDLWLEREVFSKPISWEELLQ
ncbi:hypothetical protein INR49_019224 [Caranx melampygus]|nr:hypothetical protein INR49_019224 [Caranx melampygus]